MPNIKNPETTKFALGTASLLALTMLLAISLLAPCSSPDSTPTPTLPAEQIVATNLAPAPTLPELQAS